MKNFAIIGFGGLGKMHFQNLLKIGEERKDVKLVAICNDDLEAIKKTVQTNISSVSVENVDFSKYNLYSDYKQMIAEEKLDFAIVALPTWLHCEVCVYCMEHGIDVYTEKPMALTLEQCRKMKETSDKYGKRLMIGHCLRFSDEYIYIKKLIESNEYGKVKKAEFSRKSPLPSWSAGGWLLDEEKSGGIIVDFHVHDADVINWFFGKPKDISVITNYKDKNYASIYTLYDYPDKKIVCVADWGLPSSFSFEAKYAITFEKAYVENVNGEVVVYTDEKTFTPDYEKGDCYYREINEFISCIAEDKPFETSPHESVFSSMEMLFSEKNGL